MVFLRNAWLPAVPALAALIAPLLLACSNGGTSGTGGTGGAATSSSTSATVGSGGATTTSSTSGGTGGSIAYVPSGYACSGKMPSLANDVVPITTGSCASGPSCHVALHTAGLKPLDALKAATMGGATALGLEHEIGSVAEGKRADLLIWDSDPLTAPSLRLDPSNLRYIMQGGL